MKPKNLSQLILKRQIYSDGFSLIEVVIVIVILAILALMALPNFTDLTAHASISKEAKESFVAQRFVGAIEYPKKGPLLDDSIKVIAREDDFLQDLDITAHKINKQKLIDSTSNIIGKVAKEIYDSLPESFTYIGVKDEMNLEGKQDLYVAFSFEEIKNIAKLIENPVAGPPRRVKVSDRVKVKVSSSEFAFTPITGDTLAITQGAPTVFQWSIKPKSYGKHKINVVISAIIKIDGTESVLLLDTHKENIKVTVTPVQWIDHFLFKYVTKHWPVLAAIGALLLFLYRVFLPKKTEEKSDNKTKSNATKRTIPIGEKPRVRYPSTPVDDD
jgi:prepilin-type N-terminal cleavage/methylation domain-containing protein